MIMKLSFMRISGKLHWFLDFKDDLGVSYPVFHRGSIRLLLSLIFLPSFRRHFRLNFGPTEDDLKRSLSLRDWFESLPSDPTKPLHDILES